MLIATCDDIYWGTNKLLIWSYKRFFRQFSNCAIVIVLSKPETYPPPPHLLHLHLHTNEDFCNIDWASKMVSGQFNIKS